MTLAHAPKNKALIRLEQVLCVILENSVSGIMGRFQQLRLEDEDNTTAVHNIRHAPSPSRCQEVI